MFIQSFSLSPLISIHVLELTPDTPPSLYHLTFHLFILGFVRGGGLIFPHVSAQLATVLPGPVLLFIVITEDDVMSFNSQGNQSPRLWHLLPVDSEKAIGLCRDSL